MLRHEGFSILEIMIAVAIIAALGLGIYRMQLSALSAARQGITRQQALRAADNLLAQLNTNLVYQNNNSISRSLVASETTYGDNTTLATDCSLQACTVAEMGSYILYRWKSQLANTMGLPSGNVYAILCNDSSFSAPTFSSPNCNGSGNQVIKIVWQSHTPDAESTLLGNNNYVILQVPSR